MLSQAHDGRMKLNNALQSIHGPGARLDAKWEISSTGPPHSPVWQATIYIDDMSYGTGLGATKGAAQESAAFQALNNLQTGAIVPVRKIGDKITEGRSSRGDVILTSRNRPILKPNDDLVSSYPHDYLLFIDLHPVQDLGPAIDDSDVSLHDLKKYMEDNNFDLRGIARFLSSSNLQATMQCAALQLLEYAARRQSTNFVESMSATFGPVANLVLDSREIQVHCAALDTLTLFLRYPHATDIVKSMMPRGVVHTVSNDLDSTERYVQLAAVELLEVAVQSEEILIEFAAAVSRIPSALSSMSTTTQVIALKVLEIVACSNIHGFPKALADEFHHLEAPLSSPEATIQIAALKVLEAGAGTKDPDLSSATQKFLPDVKKIQSFGETDTQSAARRVLMSLIPATEAVQPHSQIHFDDGGTQPEVRWETFRTGSPNSPTWHATIYLDDMNYGTASAGTKGAAQDEAAQLAYNNLRRERMSRRH